MRRSIYVGWDPRERDAFDVACYSMRRWMSQPIPIHPLRLDDLRVSGLLTRPMRREGARLIDELSVRSDYDGSISTEHACARFFVPHLAETGWALFCDGDVLLRADICEIFEGLNPAFAVYCVKHVHRPRSLTKMDGQVQTSYLRKNWSSVMIFNCDHPANQIGLTLDRLNSWPGRDLHAFRWLYDNHIGELWPEWNYLVGASDPIYCQNNPKLVHFTEGTPDMPGYEGCEYAEQWRYALTSVREKEFDRRGDLQVQVR